MLRGIIRGRRFLATWFLGVALLLGTAVYSPASVPPTDMGDQTYTLPICPPKSSLEAQMTNPREAEPAITFSFRERLRNILPGRRSGVFDNLDKDSHQMTAKFQFSPAMELRVSFLYNQDQTAGHAAVGPTSHLLFRYSMDYCIMPKLRVGMSGYLYKPPTDYFAWRNSLNFNDPVYGFGPAIQYDLGRWSFLLRSQLQTGNPNRGESLNSWFRVWYAF
jgi:hypothetical protein